MRVSYGDCLHLYGGIARCDYTVRLCLRLDENIEGDILKKALEKTSARYPYLCLRLKKNESEYYYEDNNLPICLFNTDEKISLNSKESNYHLWAVCYKDDFLYFDFFHGLCDGNGMYKVLGTLLYYYFYQKLGKCDDTGILTDKVEIDEGEYTDPIESLPDMDPEVFKKAVYSMDPAFTLIDDAGMTKSHATVIRDVVVPEKELLKYTSEKGASPGTFFTVMIARAINKVNPKRARKFLGGYVMNGRPMLGAEASHHNCVTTVRADFTEKFLNMPIDLQCTSMRGMTFLQSDKENVIKFMIGAKARAKAAMQIPSLEGKKQAFSRSMEFGKTAFSFMVSYVGQWKNADIGSHIKEFWTHVTSENGLLLEIAAANGNIFLSFHQNIVEDVYYKEILKQLEEAGIPYREEQCLESDISHFPDVD